MRSLIRVHHKNISLIRRQCYFWMYATTTLISIRTFAASSAAATTTIVQSQAGKKCKFIAANWKCNIESVHDVDQLVSNMNQQYTKTLSSQQRETVEVCVLVPYVYIDRVRQRLHPNIHVGSQNIYEASSIEALNEQKYKNTGTITSNMIQSVGCRYVLLGHSDRRNNLYETNHMIEEKVRLVLDSGKNSDGKMGVILTIGELAYQRQFGLTLYTLKQQLRIATKHIKPYEWDRIVIAYEPVWAIGVGAKPCSPIEAQKILSTLRSYILQWYGPDAANNCRYTYTGSVDEKNCDSYSSLPEVDGFVVGRAGLDATKLSKIIRSLSRTE
jgi:triosephosphate isomerase (TIM)